MSQSNSSLPCLRFSILPLERLAHIIRKVRVFLRFSNSPFRTARSPLSASVTPFHESFVFLEQFAPLSQILWCLSSGSLLFLRFSSERFAARFRRFILWSLSNESFLLRSLVRFMWFASASLFLPTVFRFLSCLSIGWPLRRVHSTVSDSFALSSGSLLFLRFSIRAVRSLCSAGSRFTVCFRFVLNVSLLFLRFSSQFRGLAHMSRSVSSGSLIFLIFRFSSPFRTVRSSCSLVLCLLPFERSAHITQILQPTSDSSLRFSSPFRTARSSFSDSLIPDERCSPFHRFSSFSAS